MAGSGRHRPRIGAMESVTAMLILLFQLFFGWCDTGEPGQAPAEQCDAGTDC